MKKQTFLIPLIFFLSGIVTRLPFIEKMMSHTDASSLTLALVQYNLTQETPAPPGYPLYFAVGSFFNFFIHDPHFSLLLVSVIFSGVGASFFFLFGKSLGGRAVGIISGLLFLSAPSFYFFGLTVYPYIEVIAALTAFAWCSYETIINKKKIWIWLGFSYALLIGIRPQELITTLPLFLLALYSLTFRQKIKTLIVFIAVTLMWFLPFLSIVGGVTNYMKVSTQAAGVAIPYPSLTQFIDKKFEILSGLYLTLGAGIIILFLFFISKLKVLIKADKLNKQERKKILFVLVWILPSLIFNLFIRTEHAGYQAGYLIFLIFLIALTVKRLFRRTGIVFTIATILVCVNLFIFFYDRDPNYLKPYRQSSSHYTDIRRNDYVLLSKISYIKRFYPEKAIVIVGPVYWRHIRYYLPEYQIFEIDALFTDAPLLRDVRRNAKNLTYTEFKSDKRVISVPHGVTTIILFDDESGMWVKDNKEVIRFKGRTQLTVISVKEGDAIKYGLSSIEVLVK